MAHERHPFEYSYQHWGESIYGSKEELNSLGLGRNFLFPGEPGGPKRELNVLDPRGFPCRITRWGDTDSFLARILFPGREPPWWQEKWIDVAAGVKMKENPHSNDYLGPAAALIAANLVKLENLPGQPGMKKMSVNIYADGTVAGNCLTFEHKKRMRELGAKQIQKWPGNEFYVAVCVSREESERRVELFRSEQNVWEERCSSMPRPTPLVVQVTGLREKEVQERRAAMRIVWSRPLPCNDWQIPTP